MPLKEAIWNSSVIFVVVVFVRFIVGVAFFALLFYSILQAVYIPKDLYDRAYAACKNLLKLPKPYCDVGLACVRHMQTEMFQTRYSTRPVYVSKCLIFLYLRGKPGLHLAKFIVPLSEDIQPCLFVCSSAFRKSTVYVFPV